MFLNHLSKHLKEYADKARQSAFSDTWEKELLNISAKVHVSRLEALKTQLRQQVEMLFAEQADVMQKSLGESYKSDYYHSAYEIQKGFNVGWDMPSIDQNAINTVLSKPWAPDGYNFSERIWNNKEKLLSELNTVMTQNIMTGAGPQKAIDTLAKKMNTSRSNAGRLVMTESAYFSSLGRQQCFKDLDVEKYEIVATLDGRTSETCRHLDGKVFDIDDYKPGTNAPPMHCWCRSCIVPYFDDMEMLGKRAARDPETGKTVRVPADMKYKDWEAVYVDKNISYEQWKQKDGIIKTKSGIDKIEKLEKSGMSHSDYTEFLQILNGHSNSDIVKLYRDYADGIQSVTLQGTGGAYSSGNNTIVYSYPKNKYQGMNKYRTLAHEYGHYFDAKTKFPGLHFVEIEAVREATTLKKVFPTVASSSDEFLASMRKDKEYIKNILTQDVRNELRQNHSSCGVQDAIDGLFTNSRISWGHGEKYYNRKYASVEFIDKHTKMGCKKKLKQVYLQLG